MGAHRAFPFSVTASASMDGQRPLTRGPSRVAITWSRERTQMAGLVWAVSRCSGMGRRRISDSWMGMLNQCRLSSFGHCFGTGAGPRRRLFQPCRPDTIDVAAVGSVACAVAACKSAVDTARLRVAVLSSNGNLSLELLASEDLDQADRRV